MDALLTPEIVLRAYACGIFPMAEARGNPQIHWVDPKRRGIIPLDRFHLSRSLSRKIRTSSYAVRINTDFAGVVQACAARSETWINDTILQLYLALHHAGFAQSLEVWDGTDLVGGVYGVTLGAAFFGESMFSHRTDASKLALAYLVDRLRIGGFTLFDTQFLTPHLQSLGAVEISRADYRNQLQVALTKRADFNVQLEPLAADVLQRNSQMS